MVFFCTMERKVVFIMIRNGVKIVKSPTCTGKSDSRYFLVWILVTIIYIVGTKVDINEFLSKAKYNYGYNKGLAEGIQQSEVQAELEFDRGYKVGFEDGYNIGYAKLQPVNLAMPTENETIILPVINSEIASYTARELTNEFRGKNVLAVSEAFENRTIKVTGKINSINSNFVLELGTSPYVSCRGIDVDDLKNLVIGSEVTVVGTFAGGTQHGSVSLKNCFIVK